MIGHVVFVKVAARQNRNAPGLEISRRDIVRRRGRALRDGQHVALRPGVKCLVPARQRKIAADRRALESGNGFQRLVDLIAKTGARGEIRILRRRQRDKTDPEILRFKSEIGVT